MRCTEKRSSRRVARSALSVGPLKPGRYEFVDDFNKAARGFIVVK